MEQKHRRQLRPGRPQEAQPARRRCGEDPLVRENDAALVRLESGSCDQTVPRARDAVRACEGLLDAPDRGTRLAHQDPRPRPLAQAFGGELGLVRADQANDVVRAPLAVVDKASPGDDVVRRGDEVIERPGCLGVEAERAKRLHEWRIHNRCEPSITPPA